MRGAVLYGPRDIRFEDRETPKIVEPTDAIIRISLTCVCGSDLWPYRGLQPIEGPTPMGHEYCGVVEEVGGAVRSVKPGQFVIGSFATSDVVAERGDEGVKRIVDMTGGVGADSVLECVGTQQSMMQAIRCTRRGGHVSYVGVPHGVELNGQELFFVHVHLHGGPAPVRHFLPELIDLVWKGKSNPGKVFDLTLPLDQVAKGYRAMDERRAIKTLLWP